MITRLGDILVIQAIRSWIETDPAAQTGWLGALQDRQIGRAIALIHREPARAWTVASLADEAAMSRSAFAARFTELVGEPAMHYLARWRMHLALTALKRRRRDRRRACRSARLPIRGRVRAGLQTRHRRPAGRGETGRRPPRHRAHGKLGLSALEARCEHDLPNHGPVQRPTRASP